MHAEQSFAIRCLIVTNDDRLAAPEWQPGQRVLVSHAVRQAQGVGERFFFAVVIPEACTANGWTKCGVMDGNDAVVTSCGISPDQDSLVIGIGGFLCDFHSPVVLGATLLRLPNQTCCTHPDSGLKRLLCRLFALEHVTRLYGRAWIDRDVSFIDVPNDAFFIDHKGSTIAKPLLLVEDAIIFDNGALEIAEQRERNADLFGEFAVGGNAVNTQSENLGFG